MKNNKLYNLVIKADKEANNKGTCTSCFCYLVECYLEDFNLDKPFLAWKEKNNIDTTCSSILFYLQDLGIIKILSGVPTRSSGVFCDSLKIKLVSNPNGNKI